MANEVETFSTGAIRDNLGDKPRWELVSPYIILKLGVAFDSDGRGYGAKYNISATEVNKVAKNVAKFQITHNPEYLIEAFKVLDPPYLNMITIMQDVIKADRYPERNWEKGMTICRCIGSTYRHLMAYYENDRSEDHLGALGCNLMFIYHYMQCIQAGTLPSELNDLPRYQHGTSVDH